MLGECEKAQQKVGATSRKRPLVLTDLSNRETALEGKWESSTAVT